MTNDNKFQLNKGLKEADLDQILQTASFALSKNSVAFSSLSISDVSGNSGSKTYLCSDGLKPKCIVKVGTGDSIMNSHPFTAERVQAATAALRKNNVAPPILLRGRDFHVELSAGNSVMKDFFHFDHSLAPMAQLAAVMARIHSTAVDWYVPLKSKFLRRDTKIADIFKNIPSHAPAWCLPWSGLDTGMPVLGVGNPKPSLAKKILMMMIETGVYRKIMNAPAFFPISSAAKREVVVHNDFKPDNILRDPESGKLTAIDYDLVQVGPAVIDFGLPFMMWLGPRYTTFEARKTFIKKYLDACSFPTDNNSVAEFMLDCEVNTIVAFPGLLSNIYDAEIPLLRGIQHPTAKPGFLSGGVDVSPSGLELVDLLSTAVGKVRSDAKLSSICIKDGLVRTMLRHDGFGSKRLQKCLKQMQKNKMLRLFGIAETDGGKLFVSNHALQ